MAPDYSIVGTLLAAGADGSLHLSGDSGLTWRALEVPFLGEEVATVAFSPDYASDHTLFVATSRRPGEGIEGRASVWQSTDGGANWQQALAERDESRWISLAVPPTYGQDGAFFIGLGGAVLRPMRRAAETRLGARRPIWVREQPGSVRTVVVGLTLSPDYAQDSTLFAATSTGVSVSRNAGLSWRSPAEGLIDRSIVAVALSPGYAGDRLVFAASLGGTIWRLHDSR
jgi:hypothetical protein